MIYRESAAKQVIHIPVQRSTFSHHLHVPFSSAHFTRQRLLMAAGQDLEPYWEIYRQHFRGHVVEWMEKYRIGNLTPEDSQKARDVKVSKR